MKTTKLTVLKTWLFLGLMVFLMNIPLQAGGIFGQPASPETDEPPVTVTEVRYEKLMKLYLNKIKMAFTETEDSRSLAILSAFSVEFSQKTDIIKKELQLQVEDLNPREAEMLYSRISRASHTEELVALLFDERVTSRMTANQELKEVMEQLHAKSLEVQKSEREFIAVGK